MWEWTDRNQKKKCSFNSVHYKINHTYIEIILRPVSWGLTVCAAIEIGKKKSDGDLISHFK